jgi:sugar phosphate isomerase/epimerase
MRKTGLACEACNNFFPPRVRLTGPDARQTAAFDYAQRAMDRAANLGAKIIVFGSSAAKNVPAGFDRGDAWKQIVDLLANLGPMAQVRGITIAIEPLNRLESNIINLAAEGLELVRQVAHPNVQLLIDYYHMTMEKESLEIIASAGAAIRHVHLANVEGRTFPTIMQGDFRNFFDTLRLAGYAGRCSVEAYTLDFSADAARALQVLRQLT